MGFEAECPVRYSAHMLLQQPVQIPGGVERRIYTGFTSWNCDCNAYFETESELTKPSAWGGDWLPERWDVLGRMEIVGSH